MFIELSVRRIQVVIGAAKKRKNMRTPRMKACTNLDVRLQRIAWCFANHRGIAGELNGFTGFGAGHAADNSKDEALQPLGVRSDSATNSHTTVDVRLQRNAWCYTNYQGLAGELNGPVPDDGDKPPL